MTTPLRAYLLICLLAGSTTAATIVQNGGFEDVNDDGVLETVDDWTETSLWLERVDPAPLEGLSCAQFGPYRNAATTRAWQDIPGASLPGSAEPLGMGLAVRKSDNDGAVGVTFRLFGWRRSPAGDASGLPVGTEGVDYDLLATLSLPTQAGRTAWEAFRDDGIGSFSQADYPHGLRAHLTLELDPTDGRLWLAVDSLDVSILPEPSVAVLLGLGAGCLLPRRRRRR